jgi:hypothetical protein
VGLGFSVELSGTGLSGPGVSLVAEGSSRWMVEVRAGSDTAFERAFRGLPIARLGEVAEGPGMLTWKGRRVGRVDVASLYERWRGGLER